ncbi:phage head closure protein [Streptomyces nymphaeiformis]|jgi:SPP1 family predicted phage head-tail adaptor|uniref:SPP1 family predicted phage head-tail adaptor n=1 Tax=Streptomyces nymphaeiformis TaxID=2663842 RepID=A0A7W7UB81_9ACTN|nr:phage head closure protein [Streptomyces nymphaeiformis]MBB4987492.1 SPP1 family predicted phage head-tail adaptor [Streptomyces nymphaeiformis]
MIGRLLNRTLAVWRPVDADDGYGGQETTLVLQGEVRAKVDQPAASDRVLAQQAGAEHTHDVYLLPTADVERGDELHGGGQVLTVRSVVEPSSTRYRKAECRLLQRRGD